MTMRVMRMTYENDEWCDASDSRMTTTLMATHDAAGEPCGF